MVGNEYGLRTWRDMASLCNRCGLLFRSMYGTRDAAANFAATVIDTLTNMVVKFSAFLCRHARKDIGLFTTMWLVWFLNEPVG